VAIALTILPLVFLWALVKLLPPWPEKSALGIAGAYLLRAVAESTSLPRLAVAAIAIVYAMAVAGMGFAGAGRAMVGQHNLCLHVGVDPGSHALGTYTALQGAACRVTAGVLAHFVCAATPWRGSAISHRSSGWPM
jgi:hypothetical protein